jgi:hypothetical protein
VNPELRSALVDELLELYCEWREDSARVQTAYERFADAEPEDRKAAYAVYLAAVDQEEAAARTYADQISCVSSQLRTQSINPPDPTPARSTGTHPALSSFRTSRPGA